MIEIIEFVYTVAMLFFSVYSGVRLETAQRLVDALNGEVLSYHCSSIPSSPFSLSLSLPLPLLYAFTASCLPFIPDKGTVGASGDLAPLSHLALGMMGEGNMWSPESGWSQAGDILHAHQLKPITLQAKEVRVHVLKLLRVQAFKVQNNNFTRTDSCQDTVSNHYFSSL